MTLELVREFFSWSAALSMGILLWCFFIIPSLTLSSMTW